MTPQAAPSDPDPTPGENEFWELAQPLLARPDVERSTMMGIPCLRINGQFFACTYRANGDLLVKLPEARVDALVEAGHAGPFAPSGRRFREWAAIPHKRARSWPGLLDEALAFVSTLPPKKAGTKKRTAR